MSNTYHHILFATDFSELNRSFGDKLIELASAHKAKLSVLHVVTSFEAFIKNHSLTLDLKATLEKEAKEMMEEWCKLLRVPTTDQIVLSGEPVKNIIKAVHDVHADLLIIGSHGKSGLAQLLGSVTQKLMHQLTCDVLVLKPNKPR